MPIYEYSCQPCGHQFEELVRGEMMLSCPLCGSEDVERLMSLPKVQSENTRAMSLRAAKRRDAKRAVERVEEQRRYEQSHEGH